MLSCVINLVNWKLCFEKKTLKINNCVRVRCFCELDNRCYVAIVYAFKKTQGVMTTPYEKQAMSHGILLILPHIYEYNM